MYIDPWGETPRAIITHGHGDHVRSGSHYYLAARESIPILKSRLGENLRVEGMRYGHTVRIGGARVSLHPVGGLSHSPSRPF
jgi:putative mRNA 3-end processing factor